MTIVPPNYSVPVVDPQGKMTPQFLKFLEALGKTAPGSVEGNVATLLTDVATLQTDVATLVAGLAATNATVAAQGTHLSNLPTSRLTGSTAYNPPNLLAGTTTTQTVAVVGATLGMAAEASFSLDITGLVLTAYVDSANSVTTVWYNPTLGAIDIANGTLKAFAWNP